MTVYFISDLHLCHKNILKFSGKYRSWAEGDLNKHDSILIERINSVVHKRDKLFILGDVVFGRANLHMVAQINGYKHLIMGNHDSDYHTTKDLLKYFDKVSAIENYKGYWLTHAPIHPCELRGKKNIHGHVHHNSVKKDVFCQGDIPTDEQIIDPDYINVCVEMNQGYPVSYEELRGVV